MSGLHATRRTDRASRIRTALLGGGVLAAALAFVAAPMPIPIDLALLAHVSGLVAGYVVAVMVLLMSRTPLLEREVGADRLARWHGRGGRIFVVLMLVHAIAATAAWSLARGLDPFSAALEVMGFPWLVAATAGTVLFLGIAGVSIAIARRRLRYETWHTIHLLTYVALALSFGHELAGPNLAGYPVVQVVWSLLFVVPLGLVVRYRMLRPLEQLLRHRLVVDAVIPEAAGVASIILRGRHLDELDAAAGQFFRWRFLTPRTWTSAHPFSLSEAPRPDRLRITVKALGSGSTTLHALRPGTRVLAEGPYGAMTAARRSRPSVLLVAGGVGITPMRALFETLDAGSGEITLLYRASSDADLVFREELEELAAVRGGRVIWLVGRSREPANALDGENLLRLVPDLPSRDVYLCASPAMSAAVRAGLREAGHPSGRLHEEVFAF